MLQIILKESTAHLGSYTFLLEILINIKTHHFHSSINHQELSSCEYCKDFKIGLFDRTSPEAVACSYFPK